MSCPYCRDFDYWTEDSYDPEESRRTATDIIDSNGDGSFVAISEDCELVLCDYDEHEDTYQTRAVEIRFCPMCGRAL